MTSVYVVESGDCESSWIVSIHQTEEGALVAWKEERVRLLAKAREMLEWANNEHDEGSIKMYEKMVKNLEETDPKKIYNYPHECCYLTKHELEK